VDGCPGQAAVPGTSPSSEPVVPGADHRQQLAVLLASLYPGVTVLLARVVPGERLRWVQRAGRRSVAGSAQNASFR
jgi:hypothetical protein